MKKKESKKSQQNKLPLKHETIRQLDIAGEDDLKTAAGGCTLAFSIVSGTNCTMSGGVCG
jgi:hypothetical protein